MFFLAQPKVSNLELKSLTNMILSERLLMVSNSLGWDLRSKLVGERIE